MRNTHFKELDVLRGLAAMGIAFIFHYQHFPVPFQEMPWYPALGFLYRRGYLLVQFFFVLSGFVLTLAYKERVSKQEMSAKNFSLRRLARLYPLHIVTLVFVALLQAARQAGGYYAFIYQLNDVHHFVLNLLLLHGLGRAERFSFNGPSWSISVEAMLYAIFFLYARTMRTPGSFRLVCVLSIPVGLVFSVSREGVFMYTWQLAHGVMGFFLGCLIYEYRGLWQQNVLVRPWKCALLLTELFAVVYFQIDSVPHDSLLSYTLASLGACVVILAVSFPGVSRVLCVAPLVYMGAISYSLYLWHFPCQLMIVSASEALGLQIDYTSPVVLVLYGALVTGVAALSFRYLEKPMMQRVRRQEVTP